jgi:hypothetical protein
MPQYYFHIRRGQITILDHEGTELADTTDAEVEAAERAQGLVNEDGASAGHGRIVVADDNWQTLFELPF